MTGDRTIEQQFYDRNGYYEFQSYNPDRGATYVAWVHDFDNRPRHCWEGVDPDKDNEPTRWLDNRTPEYIAAQRREDSWSSDEWKKCVADHSADPKVVGNIEWLRFIREYSALAPEGQRYFTEDGLLWISPTGLPMPPDGRRMYAEAYFNRPPAKLPDPGFRFRLKFAHYLANGQQFSRIACFDEELFDLCQKALLAVEASYEKEAA